MTHYLPIFTKRRDDRQRAVCGEWIRISEHSNEPTCPTCLAYVRREEEDDVAIADALGLVNENGVLVPNDGRPRS